MKTNDFIEEARDLGLFVEENKNQNIIWIKTPYEDNYVGEVKTDEIGCRIFDESKRFPGISKLIYEYGMTPLEEREEEKKYRYKLPFRLAVTEIEKDAHLRKDLGFIVIDSSGVDFSKVNSDFHFTDKEVEEYTGKKRALFNACEKIEVTSND